jgi:phosphoribosylformimino-5-aminoimidazole carboxamide ribonucleotide (ProFAR) isomerase
VEAVILFPAIDLKDGLAVRLAARRDSSVVNSLKWKP